MPSYNDLSQFVDKYTNLKCLLALIALSGVSGFISICYLGATKSSITGSIYTDSPPWDNRYCAPLALITGSTLVLLTSICAFAIKLEHTPRPETQATPRVEPQIYGQQSAPAQTGAPAPREPETQPQPGGSARPQTQATPGVERQIYGQQPTAQQSAPAQTGAPAPRNAPRELEEPETEPQPGGSARRPVLIVIHNRLLPTQVT